MEFAIISPSRGLERYSTLSKTHLLLCQIEDLAYWDFYIKRKAAGDFIILDNGAYEGECDWAKLRGRINRVHPNVVALPDFVAQPWKMTRTAAFNFLEDNYSTYTNVDWMYIPQAEPNDMIGLLKSLFYALDDERISWIGLPRALCYKITQDPHMRVKMAERIKKYNDRVKVHALGMVKGSVDELNLLRQSGCVHTIDSNAPVWRGWCGYDISSKWPEIPVRYDDPSPPREIFYKGTFSNHELILNNLEACGVNTDIHSRSRVPAQRGDIPSGEDNRP